MGFLWQRKILPHRDQCFKIIGEQPSKANVRLQDILSRIFARTSRRYKIQQPGTFSFWLRPRFWPRCALGST